MKESNEFLPTDYESPKVTGGYTRFDEGSTKLRILSSVLLLWVTWNEGQPERARYDGPDSKPHTGSKHTWAVKVYNYGEGAVQVWEIHQATIRNTLKDLAANEDWGNPLAYDITINRTGTTMSDTKYTVTPSPAKALPEDIMKTIQDTNVNLEALLTGDNPFSEDDEGLPF